MADAAGRARHGCERVGGLCGGQQRGGGRGGRGGGAAAGFTPAGPRRGAPIRPPGAPALAVRPPGRNPCCSPTEERLLMPQRQALGRLPPTSCLPAVSVASCQAGMSVCISSAPSHVHKVQGLPLPGAWASGAAQRQCLAEVLRCTRRLALFVSGHPDLQGRLARHPAPRRTPGGRQLMAAW